MGIYNGVWEHLYRSFVADKLRETERGSLLPSYEDANRTSFGSGLSETSPNGAYITSDNDSIN